MGLARSHGSGVSWFAIGRFDMLDLSSDLHALNPIYSVSLGVN